MNGLGACIAAARKERGITGAHLAAQIGSTAAWIRHLETGRINTLPRPDRLRAIAAALDVPMTTLLEAAGYLEPGA